jgi:hypothetical protein
MKSKSMKIILSIVFVLVAASAVLPQIKIVPLDTPTGEFGPIGFKMYVPWMDGSIEMRNPETVDGEEGMYFIDHYRPDMLSLSKMGKYPEWKYDDINETLSYSYTTQEGVEFGGIVSAVDDEVHMEFIIKNQSDRILRNVNPQLCLKLTYSNDFNLTKETSDVFLWSGGKLTSVDKLTPSPEEKHRDALMVIGRKGFTNLEGVGKTKYNGPGQDIFMSNYVKDANGNPLFVWWMTNEESDEDIILRESRDKKHLVAVAWPGSVAYLVYNSLNPCIHAGPSIQFTIEPQRERHWYGTIYLMQNDKDELMKKFKNGQRYN